MPKTREFTWLEPTGSDDALSPDGLRVIGLLKYYLPVAVVARLHIGDLTRSDIDEFGNHVLIAETRAPLGAVSAFVADVMLAWDTRRRVHKGDGFLQLIGKLFIRRAERRPVEEAEVYAVPVVAPEDF